MVEKVTGLLRGDCLEQLRKLPDNSVDAVVTDPPYGIEFMGKDWDKSLPPREAFREVFRVLKPGALAFVMSSPRQDLFCRMGVMLEDGARDLRLRALDDSVDVALVVAAEQQVRGRRQDARA